ncbi:MAG: sugar phosphate isomerase/epimerase [Anaerolineae bacterium]|jgi:sugar phosphate isomerase/epimerase|nr:sugar phosphate isomerase/epimerase [Anaerolineae bacterium]
MRLGGFFDEQFHSPEAWVAILQSKGYRAAYAPYRIPTGGRFPSDGDLLAYRRAAQDADIVIAEVGAWGRNYVAEDEDERGRAIEESIQLLQMAEALGARCLVNSAGWRRDPAEAFAPAIFDLIVRTIQTILDAVNPTETRFTLELVPDIFPYSCDSYRALLEAVDRPGFGVHFDLANIAVTPYLCYHSAELIEVYVAELGPFIRSCHAKDVVVSKGMVVHIDEVRPGLGRLDYHALIGALDRLDQDMPLMLEHLPSNEEYRLAAEHLRSVAAEVNAR